MSLYEAEEPLVPMASAPTPPRPWEAMLVTWAELMATLAAIVGEKAPTLDAGGLAALIDRLHLLTWTWMWSLPPMARKAAFELGRAAILIGRWRSCISEVLFRPDEGFPLCLRYMVGKDDGRTTLQTSEEAARALPAAQTIGQQAESALRIVARQIEDARDEAKALALGHDPPDLHVALRVYELKGSRRLRIANKEHDLPPATELARLVLADYFATRQGAFRGSPMSFAARFAETAIASLPSDQWTMTSEDVGGFVALIDEPRT